MTQTLIDIINEIKPRKTHNNKNYVSIRPQLSTDYFGIQQSKVNTNQDHPNLWTVEQNIIFDNFVKTYGIDFSLIEAELPGKTRKQIKKKFDKAEALRKRRYILKKRLEQIRKTSLFQEQILELATSEVDQSNNNPKPNTHIN